jgi:predicted nucleotidyltransferase
VWPDPARYPDLRAICLFGSAARDESAADSDVDVLVVMADSSDALGLRRQLRSMKEDVNHSSQICLMTEERLRRNFADRTVFAAHLAREGRVVDDHDGVIEELLADFPVDAPVQETAGRLNSQLDVYEDLVWCGGYYLFCLADLYAWSRSGAMLALARAGEFEFDRDRVFARLGSVHPDLRAAAEVTRRLRPFWERVNRHGTAALPFSPVGSDREAKEAREACRAILEKSL